MSSALDDVRFLADSSHRAVALAALSGGTRSRGELRDVTGASSATVGRIVSAFEERGWLTRDGGSYSLTALGAFVARSFARTHRDMEVARDLEKLLPYVPLEEIGVDVEQLTDARITRASHANPFAVVSRVRELELDSATARSLTDFFPEPCIDGRYEAIVEGTQTFEAVFSPQVFEAAMASDAAAKFAAIVAADRATISVHEDDIAYPVMLHDGVGCLIVRNEANVSVGMIETDHEAFVEWVTAVHERHRTAATPVTPDDLAAYRPGALHA